MVFLGYNNTEQPKNKKYLKKPNTLSDIIILQNGLRKIWWFNQNIWLVLT